VNRSLVVQAAHNEARIDGYNLAITWNCSGYRRAAREASMDFSIDSDNNVPFEQLKCFAHDLRHDPERRHPIRPILLGPDGISKKIAIPFLQPLRSGESFNIALTCELPVHDGGDRLLYCVDLVRLSTPGADTIKRLLSSIRPASGSRTIGPSGCACMKPACKVE